jgi:hypothetical protein
VYMDTYTGTIKCIRWLVEPYPKPRQHELTVKAGRFVDGLCHIFICCGTAGHYAPGGFNVYSLSPSFLLSSNEPVSRPWAGIRQSIGSLYIYAVRILIQSLCKDYLGRWASSYPYKKPLTSLAINKLITPPIDSLFWEDVGWWV